MGKLIHRPVSLRSKMLIAVLTIILVMTGMTYLILQLTVYSRLQKDVVDNINRRMEQTSQNLSSVFSQVAEDMVDISEDISKHQVAESIYNSQEYFSIRFVQEYLKLIKPLDSFKYIHSLMLVTQDGNNFYQSNANHYEVRDNLFDYFEHEMQEGRIITWTAPYQECTIFNNANDSWIVSAVMEIKQDYKVTAYLVTNLEVSKIQEFLRASQGEEHLVIQFDGDHYISDGSAYAVDTAGMKNLTEAITVGEHDYYFRSFIPTTRWNLILAYPRSKARATISDSLSLLLSLLAICCLCLLSVGVFTVYEITNPINIVTADIQRSTKNGELTDISFVPKTNDELGVMVNSYNKLIRRIQEDHQKIEEEQRLRNMLYLRTLQMQINPHFLYNTLETLQFLVQMQDPRAIEMVQAIGTFYKESLINGDDLCTIRSEVTQLDSYLKIMKIRYGSKFDYTFEVDVNILENVAIKLMLQPFAENSLSHGIKQSRNHGEIHINGYQDENECIIDIFDNGIGMNETKMAELNESLKHAKASEKAPNIGISNVHHRIQLRFGAQYGVQLFSKVGEYTIVRIRLPNQSKIQEI